MSRTPRLFGESERAGKGEKKEQKREGKKDDGDLKGFEQMEKP